MNRQDEHPLFAHTNESYTHEKYHDSLLMTKCCVPVTPHPLIIRSHLMTLLDTVRHYPLTLISAPAGFGKTSLLMSWLQSQSAENSVVAWFSLDEHDNSPLRFWHYVLLALNQASSDSCTPALTLFHSSQDPPLESVIATLLNAFTQTTRMHFLILDDYHVINEPLIHRSLSYLIEHLPQQLRVILLTRTDPPLNCARLRVRRQMLEVRTEHLRCNLQDAALFWREVIGIEVASALLEEAVNRTEGWLAGLQLLGLSWQKCTNQVEMLAQLHGTQRHIFDYLLEEALQQQSPVLQRFLLCTAPLERLCASACNAVMEIEDSQMLLEQLERANLFIIPLDEQRHWYRYHHLFAEMLRSRLTHTHGNEVRDLHQRASRWYHAHGYIHEAVSHALQANAWEQAADLIEYAARSHSWGNFQTRQLLPWLKQLPSQVLQTRPYLAMTHAQANIASAPLRESESWLQKIEASLERPGSSQTPEEQNRLLGHLFALRAQISSYRGDGATALEWCQKALAHLPKQYVAVRNMVIIMEAMAHYDQGHVVQATQSALEAMRSANAHKDTASAASFGTAATWCLRTQGKLHEAWHLLEEVKQQSDCHNNLLFPTAGQANAHAHILTCQANLLHEWNRLDEAFDLAAQALQLAEQAGDMPIVTIAASVSMCITLAQGDIAAANAALKKAEQATTQFQSTSLHAIHVMVDRTKLWLTDDKREQAFRWAQDLLRRGPHSTPIIHNREQTTLIRIYLAQNKPALALEILSPLQEEAQQTQRWHHVLELQLLESLAYQMLQQENKALACLSKAVHMAETEGYMRIFLDEGRPMANLLVKLRRQEKTASLSYLDRLLSAFQHDSWFMLPESKARKETSISTTHQSLLEPLSEREMDVLHLLGEGRSNKEIARMLILSPNTVKGYVSTILAKLQASNRTQAVVRARDLDLLPPHPHIS